MVRFERPSKASLGSERATPMTRFPGDKRLTLYAAGIVLVGVAVWKVGEWMIPIAKAMW